MLACCRAWSYSSESPLKAAASASPPDDDAGGADGATGVGVSPASFSGRGVKGKGWAWPGVGGLGEAAADFVGTEVRGGGADAGD